MKIITKMMGEIEVEESKVITFEKGLIGFPELNHFALVHDEERGNQGGIRWLQALERTDFALPVIDPLAILEDYNPKVEDELLVPLGELDENEMLALVTITVPADITRMSINLKAPIVINVKERKAMQLIVEGEEELVKYPVYTILQEKKKKATIKEGGL